MITNQVLASAGFKFYGKEKHLKLNDRKVVVIRGHRMFFVEDYFFWLYEDRKSDSEYIRKQRLNRLWKQASVDCNSMKLSEFIKFIEEIKQGNWA